MCPEVQGAGAGLTVPLRLWVCPWCPLAWSPTATRFQPECVLVRLQSGGVSPSVVSDSLWPQGLYSPWDPPGQNTGVGSHSLLLRIFPSQGSSPGLPHSRHVPDQLSHLGRPGLLLNALSSAELSPLPRPGTLPRPAAENSPGGSNGIWDFIHGSSVTAQV